MQMGMFLIEYTKDARKSTSEPYLIHKYLSSTVGQIRGLIFRVINRLHSTFKRGNYLPRNIKYVLIPLDC